MIQVTNRVIHPPMPFDAYQQLPGYSFSSLNGFHGVPTPKMEFGTRVHAYLLSPDEYDGVDYELVKPMAMAVKGHLGALWTLLQREITVTANFTHMGLTMPYRGRVDMCIPSALVVDLKVSEKPAIERFGYIHQVNGYAMAVEAEAKMLLSINPKNKKITMHLIPLDHSFWMKKILEYGKP